ncbi:protein WVD2-like 7 isoform X2 [Malania oleifera]|uniref:protein WVD2-like 7 isoform X2 n=1 Tax=Malania oleifera TaxID=397392 RepID=UPI0025AE3902|nr:protein WVD2-like 7 isoform X2 [Malania oleifera]
MGESACLMQPFSYVSGISNEAKEGNPLRALGESISFGRFVSESLAWEKWSSFSSNRYVEEAAKYSRPGSVAQKKAFFEAHYKSIAAKRAAALLEQANAAANCEPGAEFKDAVHDTTAHDSHIIISNSHTAVNPDPQLETAKTEEDFTAAANGCQYHSTAAIDKLEISNVEETDLVAEHQVLSENPVKIESLNELGNYQNKKKIEEQESKETSKKGSPLLKSSTSRNEATVSMSKKKPDFSSLNSSVHGALKLPSTPAKSSATTHPKEFNASPSSSSKSSVHGASKLPSTPPKSSATTHTRKEFNARPSSNFNHEASVLISKRKAAVPPSKSSVYGVSRLPSSPAKSAAAIHPLKKEINATPVGIKSTLDSWDRRRSTPKSLHMSINMTPARENKKLAPPAPLKTESSRLAGAASKASKNCSTPLRTPTMVSVSGAEKHHLATPQSENRRAKTPLHPSASGSRTTGPKWHFLFTDCSKSLNACKNKLQSPILSTPLRFKTEERAAKRKERLEERFNAKEAQRVQLQAKLKEKAETELRKLRQSLCFKARPLPDFYKERGTPRNQTKKGPVMHPESPKPGRKPSPTAVQSTASLHSWRPLNKNNISNLVLEKNGRSSTRLFSSLSEGITHENTSPNIQH